MFKKCGMKFPIVLFSDNDRHLMDSYEINALYRTFVSNHADIAYDQLRELMHNTKMLTRDLGTVLVGTQAVEAGLINQVGGIKEALGKLYAMIDERERRR